MLFVVPIVLDYERQDTICYNLVQVETYSFSDRIREIGYINEAMMNEFYAKLDATGNQYQVTFEHLRKSFADDNGEWKAYYEGFYLEDILEAIKKNGEYDMNVGDFFFVTVTNTSVTKSEAFYHVIGLSGGGSIYLKSGGVIRYGDS